MFRKVDADQPANQESNSLCGAVHCSVLQCIAGRQKRTAPLCVAVCSSVMQFVAVYCRESTSLLSTTRINKSHVFSGFFAEWDLQLSHASFVIKRRRISGCHLQRMCTWVTDWCHCEDTGSLQISLPKNICSCHIVKFTTQFEFIANSSFWSNRNELWGNRDMCIAPNGRGEMVVARSWVLEEVA